MTLLTTSVQFCVGVHTATDSEHVRLPYCAKGSASVVCKEGVEREISESGGPVWFGAGK